VLIKRNAGTATGDSSEHGIQMTDPYCRVHRSTVIYRRKR
jgi:hypothetical protein